MNGAHAHLLLNHLPVLSIPFGLVLFTAALLRKSGELTRAALWTFLVAALLVLPAYLTGEPAEDMVEDVPGVSGPAIEEHEEAAGYTLPVAALLGGVAAVGLFFLRRRDALPAWLGAATLLIALLGALILARTALAGGRVHHVETRSGFVEPAHGESGDEP